MMATLRSYAGIGSRETPADVLNVMANIAQDLAPRWILRSGYADGADQAFHIGAASANGAIENYLPWPGFNNAPFRDSRFIVPRFDDRLFSMARRFHPAWHRLSDAVRNLHARNCCQILGQNLDTPAHMVICWTKGGAGGGGTGQALRIAKAYDIPIFDLALDDTPERLIEFVNRMEAA